MTFEQFRDKAFEYALKNGCGAAETYFVSGDTFEVMALSGDIDKYAVSRSFGVNLRVQLNGKNGYAYTEKLEDPEELVRRAMDNASVIDDADEQPMQGPSEYAQVEEPHSALDDMSEREKIDLALALERETMALDERVKRVMYCTATTGDTKIKLNNTLGLCAERRSRVAASYVAAVMEQDGVLKDGMAFAFGPEADDIKKCAKEAVAEASIRFGASPVPAGAYRVMLRNDAAGDLITAFSPMFSAEDVQKGRSLMKDRIGEMVANPLVSIVDDPFYPAAPRAFDGEGVPSVRTDVIKNGRLESYLHNLKTAKKAGVESTGNAVRGLTTPVGVGPSCFYVVPGEMGYDAMVKALGDGLIITGLEGLHAGLDTVSGEFSLLARGLLVKGGEIVRAVDQITVGGSFLTLMEKVEAVGSDLKLLPMFSPCGSPSLLISELVVAGE